MVKNEPRIFQSAFPFPVHTKCTVHTLSATAYPNITKQKGGPTLAAFFSIDHRTVHFILRGGAARDRSPGLFDNRDHRYLPGPLPCTAYVYGPADHGENFTIPPVRSPSRTGRYGQYGRFSAPLYRSLDPCHRPGHRIPPARDRISVQKRQSLVSYRPGRRSPSGKPVQPVFPWPQRVKSIALRRII